MDHQTIKPTLTYSVQTNWLPLSFLLIALLSLSSPPLRAQVTQQQLKDLDTYIDQARKQWKVPGLAISIVKDGEVIHSKGYGVKNIETQEPLTDETVFAMASTTKAVTAMAMAMLVDEGNINWSDRVIDHYPEFQLNDPYVTREIRIKDLFTHNAGLGNADLLWYGLKLDSEEIVQRMRYMEPSYSFRGGYRYQNLMYLVAGQVIERVSGISWEDFVAQRIFSPLGMLRSFPTQDLSSASANRSTAHSYVQGKIAPILDTDADMIGPAGSGWTCVSDMTKWMNFLLDSAHLKGERLLSAENFTQLFRPQIIIPYESFYPSKHLTHPNWTTYGLGWFQHDYNGRAVSFHTGSLAGTVAICGLVPKEKLGVYILGNLGGAELRHALMYTVFDLFEERGEREEEKVNSALNRDWSTEFLKLYGTYDGPSWKPKPVQGAASPPTLSLDAYAGTYSHPLWGTVEVLAQEEGLRVKYGGFVFDLKHWNSNTFWGQTRPWDSIDYARFNLMVEECESLTLFGEEFERE